MQIGNLILFFSHNFILDQKQRILYRLTLSIVGHIEFVFYCIQIYTHIKIHLFRNFWSSWGWSLSVFLCFLNWFLVSTVTKPYTRSRLMSRLYCFIHNADMLFILDKNIINHKCVTQTIKYSESYFVHCVKC